MQQYADIYLLLITLHVSGVYCAHHQEYIKLQEGIMKCYSKYIIKLIIYVSTTFLY